MFALLETLFTFQPPISIQMDAKLATIRDSLSLKSISVQDMGPVSDLAVTVASTGESVTVIGNLESSLATDIDTILRKQVFVLSMAWQRKDQYTTTRVIIGVAAWMIGSGDALISSMVFDLCCL